VLIRAGLVPAVSSTDRCDPVCEVHRYRRSDTGS
jgi:hypothetical protein